jgi:excinuclease ABC subunit C
MGNLSRIVKNKTLPMMPGVYIFKNSQGTAIYIGKAGNLRKRVATYFSSRYRILLERVKDIEYIVTNSEMEALVLESNLIKESQPRYNVRLRDDKKYPYLEITKDQFPRILITRTPAASSWIYGPYTDVGSLRRLLKMLRDLFCLRSCNYDLKKKMPRPCLYYDLRKCSAPCVGYVSVEQYNNMARQVRLFLEGKNRELYRDIEEEMLMASRNQEYEKASEFRDRLRAIEKVLEKQAVFSTKGGEGDFWSYAYRKDVGCLNLFKVREGRVIERELFTLRLSAILSESQAFEEFLTQYYSMQISIPPHIYANISFPKDSLLRKWLSHKRRGAVFVIHPQKGDKRRLLELGLKNANLRLGEELIKEHREDDRHLPSAPHRVEGIDTSHIHGDEAVGVVTVFENGIPKPEEYRRFRIKFSSTTDDCAMISEVVERRYRRLLDREIIRPDLILVDGGKGQVMACNKKLKELGLGDIPVLGIAKRFEHVYTPGSSVPVTIPKTSPFQNFLKLVRDEAHRFSQRYHHLLRKKKIFL